MAKRLSRWNTYVQEADREPLELPLDDEAGTVVTVRMPSSGAIRRLNRAQRTGDDEAALVALFGESAAASIWAVAEDAPPGALQALIKDVVTEFGLAGDDPGEASASSS